MKKIIFLLSVLAAMHLYQPASASRYYISNTGNDSGDGLTELTAWKTLSYALTKIANRDSLLLRKGDVFREKVDFKTAKKDSLYIGSYGTSSQKPVVSGSVAISGWTVYKTNIYVATTNADIHYLFSNNNLMTIARYPNQGWLRITSCSDAGGSSLVKASNLAVGSRTTADYWKGGNMRWRRWSWWFETRSITASSSSGSITVTGSPGTEATAGWGFYIDNKLSELDTLNEWCYDKTAQKLYIFVPSGTHPDSMHIEGSVLDMGMNVRSSIVDGICFRQQYNLGLGISGTSEVRNCVLENIGSNSGGTALQASPSSLNSKVHHNLFRNNFNNTIYFNEDKTNGGASIIEHNTILNAGIVPAYGGDGSWHACGMVIIGKDIHVQYNRIENAGYVGVLVGSDNNFVEYNIIKNAMSTLNDGGAVYMNCNRTTVRYNIILDTEGDLESSGPWTNLGHGIWPEFLSDFRETVIEHNTVVGSGGSGIFLPNNFQCTIKNNVLYNNKGSQMLMNGEVAKGPQGHLIDSNVFFAVERLQKCISYETGIDYGTIQNNYFGAPLQYNEINGNISALQWNKMVAWVKNGNTTDSIKVPLFRTWNKGSELINDPSFTTGVSSWSADSKSIPLTITQATDQPKLPGSAMKIVFNAGNAILNYSPLLTFEENKFYELKFDYIAQNLDVSYTKPYNSNITISVFDNVTHDNIGFFTVPMSSVKRTAWLVIPAHFATSAVRIQLAQNSSITNTLWIDNVTLKQVEAQERKPSLESKILINDSSVARKFAAGTGKWHELSGKTITDSITLKAFCSMIIVRYEEDSIGGIPPIDLAGIKDIREQKNDSPDVYPNPVSEILNIATINPGSEIRIFDLYGKTVLNVVCNAPEFSFNVQELPSGIYIAAIITKEGKMITKRFVKI